MSYAVKRLRTVLITLFCEKNFDVWNLIIKEWNMFCWVWSWYTLNSNFVLFLLGGLQDFCVFQRINFDQKFGTFILRNSWNEVIRGALWFLMQPTGAQHVPQHKTQPPSTILFNFLNVLSNKIFIEVIDSR